MPQQIFVVEDSPTSPDSIHLALSEHGYEVRSFPNTSEAAKAARDNPPDLIILDLHPRPESGFDPLQTLLEDPTTRYIPMLICTPATADVEKQAQNLGSGAVPVMYRPFEMQALLDKVRSLLLREPPG